MNIDKNQQFLNNILDNYFKKLNKEELTLEAFLYPFCSYVLDQLSFEIINESYVQTIRDRVDYHITYELMSISMKCLTLEYHILSLKNEEYSSTELLNCIINKKKFYYEFFELYPFILELIYKRVSFIIYNINTFFSRLSTLSHNTEKINMNYLYLGEGDSHQRGKSVYIFEIENKKYVYKNRDYLIEEKFEKVLSFFLPKIDLMKKKIIVKNEEFIIEKFIDNSACKNSTEIKEYYYKFGFLLGIIYSIRGTDFHYENIIAHKKYPVPIDCETLFQPQIGMLNSNYSIQSTNMVKSDISNIDISALTGKELELDNTIEKLIYDSRRKPIFVNRTIKLESKNNLPKLIDRPVLINSELKEELKNGLKASLEYILENKKDYISYLENIFNDTYLRLLLRPTYKYADILLKMVHPDNCSKTIKLDEFLYRTASQYSNQIKSEEMDCLKNYDIPFFYLNTSSISIYNKDKNIIKDFKLLESPLQTVINHIKSISSDSIKLELERVDNIVQ